MIDTSLEELGIRAIHVGEDSTEMGQMAARNIASELRQRLNTQAGIRIIFAAVNTSMGPATATARTSALRKARDFGTNSPRRTWR